MSHGVVISLCVCAIGFFVLLVHGYKQDEEERNKPD